MRTALRPPSETLSAGANEAAADSAGVTDRESRMGQSFCLDQAGNGAALDLQLFS